VWLSYGRKRAGWIVWPIPSQLGDLDENDPRSLARFMRKMGDEMGEELGPEFDEVVSRLESGESPEDIEAAMA